MDTENREVFVSVKFTIREAQILFHLLQRMSDPLVIDAVGKEGFDEAKGAIQWICDRLAKATL
jgi:hypothetical protein